MNPKVSICIPTYNCSKLLLEAIGSVLDQSFEDYELIIVDDGSTDNTQEVVKAIKDERIRYFYKENGGVSSARNFGLLKTTGDYIAFLDHDDLWPDSYLAIMISKLEKAPEYGIAYTTVTQRYPDSTERKHYRIEDCTSGWLTRNLFRRGFIFTQGSVFRRHVLEGFRFDEGLRTNQEYDAFLRLSVKSKFLFVQEIEVIRRLTEGSLTFIPPVDCEKILLKERFYFRFNGGKYIPKKEAQHYLSRTLKHIAKSYYNKGARRASICLFKKALSYTPCNIEIMFRLFRSYLMAKDTDPNWRFPEPLPLINYKQA